MSIFKRIKNISAAAINDPVDRAEDPVKMLNQYLRDMEKDIADAEVAVARQVAIEKKLKHQWEEMDEMIEKRGDQALQAVEAGNDDLARRVLEDKKQHEQKGADFKQQHAEAKAAADTLRQQLSEMKREFEKMKTRRNSLVARAESAKMQKKVNETMSQFNSDSAAQGFERMSDKVMQLEAEVETTRDLGGRTASIDDEIAALGNDDIEDELNQLKQQVANKKSEDEDNNNNPTSE